MVYRKEAGVWLRRRVRDLEVTLMSSRTAAKKISSCHAEAVEIGKETSGTKMKFRCMWA